MVEDRIDFQEGYQNTSTVAFRNITLDQEIIDEGESSANIEL